MRIFTSSENESDVRTVSTSIELQRRSEAMSAILVDRSSFLRLRVRRLSGRELAEKLPNIGLQPTAAGEFHEPPRLKRGVDTRER